MSKKTFNHIAKLIKDARIYHPDFLSQEIVAKELGYGSAQFISNVERGLCGVPYKKMPKLCKILNIEMQDAINALKSDLEMNVSSHFYNRDSHE